MKVRWKSGYIYEFKRLSSLACARSRDSDPDRYAARIHLAVKIGNAQLRETTARCRETTWTGKKHHVTRQHNKKKGKTIQTTDSKTRWAKKRADQCRNVAGTRKARGASKRVFEITRGRNEKTVGQMKKDSPKCRD